MDPETSHRVLIVEDDRGLADVVAQALESAGFTSSVATTGANGVSQAESHEPELVILDLGLPDMDGTEVCRQLQEKRKVPVIMLTARAEEHDRVAGLENGATDYVTKPFSVRELVARVKTVLRRLYGEMEYAPRVLRIGDLELDTDAHAARLAGEFIELTRTEFLILRTLMEHRGQVVTKDRLSEVVWGGEVQQSHVLEVHISNLRHKIEKDPRHPEHLITVRSIGYKIV